MKPSDSELISLIIPCYNEQSNIIPFTTTISRLAEQHNINFELLFINDGSTDRTLDNLIKAQADNKAIKIINFTRNFGKEAATTAGLDQASGDAIIPIDVDGQDPAETIVQMLEKWRAGAKHVIAIRKSRSKDSWSKRLTAAMFYKIFNKVSECKIPENAGDFRLLDRSLVEHIKTLRESNRFMRGILNWVSSPDAIVYFEREARAADAASFKTKKLFSLAIKGLLSFSSWPLRVWGIIGMIISAISGIYGIILIARVLIHGRDTPGYTSLMVTILFLGGIQLLSLSIVGEYISRVFIEVKKRPLYLIDKIYSANKK